MQKKDVLNCLEEHILISLEEIREESRLGYDCEFVQGKVYAYVECLEVVWKSKGMDNNMLLTLEARHEIRK